MQQSKKKIWITGASSGIGKALAIKFANEGWQVAASARRVNLLKDLNKNNLNIHPFPLDVRDETIVKKVFREIIENFQNLNILLISDNFGILWKARLAKIKKRKTCSLALYMNFGLENP